MTRNEIKKEVLDIIKTPPPSNLDESFLDAFESFRSAYKRGTRIETGFNIKGFDLLSEATGGLRERGFSIICGPSGAGKTTLLANLWVAFSQNNMPCFTAPVENGKEDFIDMVVSIVSGKSRLGMTKLDWDDVKEKYAAKYFSDRRNVFSNHESRVNHIDLLTEIYYAYKTKGVKIALCDNWQFMLDVKSGDYNHESDKALHECVVFSKHVPVHIFMVMHPKKTDDERVKSMFDVKGSSTSVQEAHNIWLFNKLGDNKEAPPMTNADFCREIRIAKARYNGRSVGTNIIYSLDPVCERYKEYRIR